MEAQEFKKLLDRYIAGESTAEENAWLEAWYMNYGKGELKLDEQELLFAQQQIWAKFNKVNSFEIKKTRLWPRIAAAATILLAAGAGVFFYTSRPVVNRNSEIVNQNDIAPGRNTATITLANGKTIQLSDAKTGVIIDATSLKYNDNTQVNTSAITDRHPELVSGPRTVQTPRGGQYQITLPDGTKVWLNAASSLSFPSTFQGLGNRKVELSGEAYFEVAKDKTHPFIVTTDKQTVEVLGTHFNINSYADEPNTKTTLLEGSVRVVSLAPHEIVNRKSNIVTLLPNQQATLTGNNQLKVENANVNNAIAWKLGRFTYKNTPLDVVMRQISRWYDIDVNYTNNALKNELFSGSVSRYDKVSRILNTIEFTGVVKFKLKGRSLTITN